MTRKEGKNKYPINQTVKIPCPGSSIGDRATNRKRYPTGLLNLFCLIETSHGKEKFARTYTHPEPCHCCS